MFSYYCGVDEHIRLSFTKKKGKVMEGLGAFMSYNKIILK